MAAINSRVRPCRYNLTVAVLVAVGRLIEAGADADADTDAGVAVLLEVNEEEEADEPRLVCC